MPLISPLMPVPLRIYNEISARATDSLPQSRHTFQQFYHTPTDHFSTCDDGVGDVISAARRCQSNLERKSNYGDHTMVLISHSRLILS